MSYKVCNIESSGYLSILQIMCPIKNILLSEEQIIKARKLGFKVIEKEVEQVVKPAASKVIIEEVIPEEKTMIEVEEKIEEVQEEVLPEETTESLNEETPEIVEEQEVEEVEFKLLTEEELKKYSYKELKNYATELQEGTEITFDFKALSSKEKLLNAILDVYKNLED